MSESIVEGARAERASRQRSLLSLFLVSFFSISFETFLTRYFAVALFSQYSYWIISIAMLGYSVGGVILTLFEGFFQRRRREVMFLVPLALTVFTVLALAALRSNPFNPQEFQSPALWKGQVVYVLLYYLGLFPVFFLSGVFVGLNFLVFYREMGRVYAVDLFGAAAGALAILGLMFLLHPYHLPAAMLVVLFLAFLVTADSYFGGLGSLRSLATVTLVLLGTGSAILWIARISPLSVPDFKPLHPIVNIAGSRVVRSVLSPAGAYLVMDDYTERDDLAMTNDYGKLRIGYPPPSYGIYIDAIRVAPLLKTLPRDLSYVEGSLSHFPYTIRSGARVLLVGTNGGFLPIEGSRSGASGILAVEQRRVLFDLAHGALRRADPQLMDSGNVRVERGTVFSALRRSSGAFDIIEIASDYLAQGDGAGYAFTREAASQCLDSLTPGGILSIPVDISEINVFALKVMKTVMAALEERGVTDPAAHLMAYRTSWTCQILVSNEPFRPSDVTALRAYCSQRSFDTPWYPGIDPAHVYVWNYLPPLTFEPSPAPAGAQPAEDALMQELVSVVKHPARPVSDSRYFDLAPSSLDRPDFYAVSRVGRLRALLANMSLLPQKEVGYLLNVFVLAQSVMLGIVVLLIPLFLPRRTALPRGPAGRIFARTLAYFGALGLGYLFIELAYIQKLSMFLEGATTSFAVTLSSMLVFSGLGSWSSHRLRADPRRALLRSLPVIGAGALFIAFALDPLLLAAVGLPQAVKIIVAIAVVAPFAFAMGRPFPLGNDVLGNRAAHLVPWAWAINGAFSVISTPLASMISTSAGWKVVLVAALVLYLSTGLTLPKMPSMIKKP
jgi:hypothetical protein